MNSSTLASSGPQRHLHWFRGLSDRLAHAWPAAILDLCLPSPSPEERKRIEIVRQIEQDLDSLRARARSRSYPDTLTVLVFYWLMTVRETYTTEHWRMLKNEVQALLQSSGSLSPQEVAALEQAAEWIHSTRPSQNRSVRRENLAPPFTSAQFAPPAFISQAFLETLLNSWLPERVLERYGRRVIPGDWSSENAYEETALCLEDILRPQAVFADVETLRALDRIQNRRPTPPEEVLDRQRRRQAGLESLVTVPLRDAGGIDPKLREILTDVILYLLGATSAPQAIEPGYGWLLPTPQGSSLPADLAKQVSEHPLPPDYAGTSTLFIPFKTCAPPPRSDKLNPLSIHSTLLTPDGRIWEAHHLEQTAGAPPGIVYRASGRIDVTPTAQGLLLQVPLASWPEEIGPQFSREMDLELYHRRWELKRMEASCGGAFITYQRVSQPLPPGVGALPSSAAGPAPPPEQVPASWPKAS